MIIFDLDGTLWETIDATYKATQNIRKKHEDIHKIDVNTVIEGMGSSFEENAKRYMPYLPEEKSQEYLKEIILETTNVINQEGANVYLGVEEVIKNLSEKYKLGIITNNKNEYIDSFLKLTNLKKYFIDWMGTASYNLTKAAAIKEMVSRNKTKNNCYVGDIKKDWDAARAANVLFIQAKYGFQKDLEVPYFINNIKELPEIIENIYKNGKNQSN